MNLDSALPYLRLAWSLGFATSLSPDCPHPLLNQEEIEVWFSLGPRELEQRGLQQAIRKRLLDSAAGLEAAKTMLQETKRLKLGLLWPEHPDWPQQLLSQPDAPPVLWYLGDPKAFGHTMFTVVGTRQPSPYGTQAGLEFSEGLALGGCTLVSGLARGIDSIAHRAALKTKAPTIAVLGSSLDKCYPPENRPLAQQILNSAGLILSEYPPGLRAFKSSFPRRNRILAFLGIGVLVVEAALRSGTLITAEWAGTRGKPVWAVPGPYASPSSRGCHQLIREGSYLADHPASLLQDLGLETSQPLRSNKGLTPLDFLILDQLQIGPFPPEALATATRSEIRKVLVSLETLKSKGLICRIEGSLYRRVL
jgi:DNA processing protein